MNLATIFLVMSLFGLMLSALTYFRVRLAGALLIPTFVIGWIRGELVLWTLVIEGAVTLGFVSGGALEVNAGKAGLVLFMDTPRLGASPRGECRKRTLGRTCSDRPRV